MPSDEDPPLEADDYVNLDDWYHDLTYREVHLFAEGAFDGLLGKDPRPPKTRTDSWYYKGAYVIFYLARFGLLYPVLTFTGVL